MPKRRRRKKVPVLTAEEAYARLQSKEFYEEVHTTVTYFIKEERFWVRCWRDPDFAEKLNGRFQGAFDQVYQGELKEILIPRYREEYLQIPKYHFKETFCSQVTFYITDRLHWILSDGHPIDGWGAIY